jgi:hypothetical protein
VPDNETGLELINSRRSFLQQLIKEARNLGTAVANQRREDPDSRKQLLSITEQATRWLEQQDEILAARHQELHTKYNSRLWQ